MAEPGLYSIFFAKGSRVFVFGLVSIMIPIYLTALGDSPFQIGVALALVVAGNIVSNIVLTWYAGRLGLRLILSVFSGLMLFSGVLLFLSPNYSVILIACFIGNISTTGTEAGPFQSVETGALPRFVSLESRPRAYGIYNMIGYSAASVGALASSLPSYFGSSMIAFHVLFLVYGLEGVLLLFVYHRLRHAIVPKQSNRTARARLTDLTQSTRRDIWQIASLNAVDAFGGGFVSQSLLSYWFYLAYKVPSVFLGPIFLVANIITAASTFGASLLAEKLGNLRTMVYAHLLSNAFLIMIPVAGSLLGSLSFLFLRQSVSQMDVPTRQAFMADIFKDEERVPANAVTNTFRSGGSIFGAPITGVLFATGLFSIPLFVAGFSKIIYDLALYASYRKRAR